MKCVNHLDKEAMGVCNHCGKSICSDCQVEIKGEVYCKECLAIKMSKEKKEERSPALAAILSFIIGGLGQIYNGQFGKGILIFFTSWLIFPWIIGIFDAYKTAKKINEGKVIVKSRPGCLIATIIGIVIFFFGIFFLAILAAIAIPSFLKARVSANEVVTEATLKTISTALETYRGANNGVYPLEESVLVSREKPYLQTTYNHKTISGYTFSETLNSNGYKVIAEPEECGSTGNKIFSIETRGILSSWDCQKQ